MFNYYFIQNIEIALYSNVKILMAIKCKSMFHYILGLEIKINLFRKKH